MYQLINHIPHVPFAALVDNGIVTEGYLKKALHQQRQGKVSCWPHTKQGREVWLNFEGLKYEYQQALINQLGDPYQTTRQQAAGEALRRQAKAEATLVQLHEQHHRVTDIQHYRINHKLPTHKATDLAWGAAWLRLLNAYKTSTDTRTINYNNKNQLREAVLQSIIADADSAGTHRYGFKVQNARVLQNKELAWRKAGAEALDSLVPGYKGNTNAQKIGKGDGDLLLADRIDLTEFHAATLLYLFMNPGRANKFDFENLYLRYTRKCQQASQQPVSLSAAKHFLTRPEVRNFTTWERDGFAAYDKTLPHVYGARPTMSLSKGGYDGFQVDFYTNTEVGRVMLTCVAVFDYASEAITGYDIGLVEDGRMVRNMYLNHLNLNGGRSYIEIESDRFSGNLAAETQRIFKACCQHVTQPTPNDPRGKAANPKARFVERLLQELNRLTQNVDGWKGTNITSIDRQRKPNQDHANLAQETYAHGVKQLIELVNIYNHQPLKKFEGRSRMQVFNESLNPQAPVVTPEARALLMEQHTTATVRNAKIQITVNRRSYEYPWPQYQQHLAAMGKGHKVRVYFDERDMDEVNVFAFTDKTDTNHDTYLDTLMTLERAQRAKAEQTEADLKRLGQMDKARQDAVSAQQRKQLEFEAAYLGIELPQGISLKEMEQLVAGERNRQHHIETAGELYADVLTEPAAEQAGNYYADRILRTQGHAVPVQKPNNSSSKRDFIRNRNKP